MIQLAKQEQLAKFQPFLKTLVFSTLGATLNCNFLLAIFGERTTRFINQISIEDVTHSW